MPPPRRTSLSRGSCCCFCVRPLVTPQLRRSSEWKRNCLPGRQISRQTRLNRIESAGCMVLRNDVTVRAWRAISPVVSRFDSFKIHSNRMESIESNQSNHSIAACLRASARLLGQVTAHARPAPVPEQRVNVPTNQAQTIVHPGESL